MKFIILFFLISSSSCTLGQFRTNYEMSKVRGRIEITRPENVKYDFKGKYYQWFFNEYELETSEEVKINNVSYGEKTKIFFNTKGVIERIIPVVGEMACVKKENIENPAIELIFKSNCFYVKDYGSIQKYTLPPKPLARLFPLGDYVFYVKEGYECSGLLYAQSTRENKIGDEAVRYGDIITFRMNKVWKINDKVVNDSLNENPCKIFRVVNYTLEY